MAELLKKNDVQAFEAVCATLGTNEDADTNPLHNTKRDCLSLVLEHDRLDVLMRLFKSDWGAHLGIWGLDNFEFMVENCPRVYEDWEDHDYGSSLRQLNELLVDRPQNTKEAILKGQGSSRCEKRFYELLVQDPTLWNYVSVLWVGTKDSSLRQCATKLGWRPTMLMEMLAQDNVPHAEHCATLRYPYSLYQLATIAQEKENRKQAGPGYDEYRNTSMQEYACPANANPEDVALANALMEQTEAIVGGPATTYRRFQFGGAVPQCQTMEHLVKTYASLESMDMLAEFLANDILPGATPLEMLEVPSFEHP